MSYPDRRPVPFSWSHRRLRANLSPSRPDIAAQRAAMERLAGWPAIGKARPTSSFPAPRPSSNASTSSAIWTACCCAASHGQRLRERRDASAARPIFDAVRRHPSTTMRAAVYEFRGYNDGRAATATARSSMTGACNGRWISRRVIDPLHDHARRRTPGTRSAKCRATSGDDRWSARPIEMNLDARSVETTDSARRSPPVRR